MLCSPPRESGCWPMGNGNGESSHLHRDGQEEMLLLLWALVLAAPCGSGTAGASSGCHEVGNAALAPLGHKSELPEILH